MATQFWSKAEGSWRWFPVFIADIPFSILLMFAGYLIPHPLVVFGIGGTLWWYFLSAALAFFVRKLVATLHERKVHRASNQSS
jgi:hypothetical protein